MLLFNRSPGVGARLTFRASREAGLGIQDLQAADLGGDAQVVVSAAQSTCLQHAIQQPDEATIPPACHRNNSSDKSSWSLIHHLNAVHVMITRRTGCSYMTKTVCCTKLSGIRQRARRSHLSPTCLPSMWRLVTILKWGPYWMPARETSR